jgi:hypothetical protein
MNNQTSYLPSTNKPKVARYSPFHRFLINLKMAFNEKRVNQEKKPQDGKTNPME